MEFIKATYHENLKTVEYEAADGTRLFKTGGTLNWRFNNPGSLMPSKNTSHQPGRIGIGLVHNPSANKFSIFSSIKAGTVAKRMLLKNKYKDCTVSQMAHKFAPKEGDNDPVAYSIYILSKAGVSPTTKVDRKSVV